MGEGEGSTDVWVLYKEKGMTPSSLRQPSQAIIYFKKKVAHAEKDMSGQEKEEEKGRRMTLKVTNGMTFCPLATSMFQLAGECAVPYILFFFNFHVQGPWASFDIKYIQKLWTLEYDRIPWE